MKKSLKIVQLRSTIFLNQNIGYDPDICDDVNKALGVEGKAYGIPQPGASGPLVDPFHSLQYGMPWGLLVKCDDGEYNIKFRFGKIDITQSKEASYDNVAEEDFCQKSVEWFGKILNLVQGDSAVITRIAYAPLYALLKEGENGGNAVWGKWLKKIVYDGTPSQDVNLIFVFKRDVEVGGRNIPMNLYHNIYDGCRRVTVGDNESVDDVLMLQLDLNSLPEAKVQLNIGDVSSFYSNILEIKNKLVDDAVE